MDYAVPTPPDVAADRVAEMIRREATNLERQAYVLSEQAKALHNAARMAEDDAERYRRFQPKGSCCKNGDFGDGHDCMKQDGAVDA